VSIYFIGYKLRAGESEWNELHVVDVLPIRRSRIIAAHPTLRYIRRGTRPIAWVSELPFATLRGDISQPRGGAEGSQARVQQIGNSF